MGTPYIVVFEAHSIRGRLRSGQNLHTAIKEGQMSEKLPEVLFFLLSFSCFTIFRFFAFVRCKESVKVGESNTLQVNHLENSQLG